MNVTLNMLNCLREGQTALTSTQVVRRSTASSGRDVQSKAIGRVTGLGQARELMERVLAEAAGDVPAHRSYDGICRFI